MTSTAESWETGLDNKLDALQLEDTQQAGGAAAAREGAKQTQDDSDGVAPNNANTSTEEQQVAPTKQQTAAPPLPMPDPALLSALLDNHRERSLVLRMEQDVLNFIEDSSKDILEFPADYTNYQRMLAHKVAQYHGLQTSTADYEANLCRVIAHRSAVLRAHDKPKVRLSSIDMSPGSAYAVAAAESAHTWSEAPKLLRRPAPRHDHRYPDVQSISGSIRSAKDREEEYERAKARIFSDGRNGSPVHTGGPGRGPGVGVLGGRGRGGRGGRGDRTDLHHDPDYLRGMQQPRYGMPLVYEGGAMMMMPPGAPAVYAMHHQPGAEMAWGGGGMGMYVPAGRQPPPPPPGSSSSATSYSKNSNNSVTAWPATATNSGSASAVSSSSTVAITSVANPAPPPPPPPPHGASRPYAMPAGVMASPMSPYHPQASGSPMAIYSPGGMQMPAGTMMFAVPGGYGYPGYMPMNPDGTIAMAPHPAGMGAYPATMTHAGAYAAPHGAVHAMAPQGYSPHPAYVAASPGTAHPHNPAMAAAAGAPGVATAPTAAHGMAARPGTAPAPVAMAYAPMPVTGYTHMPYHMQAMPAGAVAAPHGAAYGPAHSFAPQNAGHHAGGGGYHAGGRGRGGYHNNHKHHGQQGIGQLHHGSASPHSGPGSSTTMSVNAAAAGNGNKQGQQQESS